MFAFGIRASLEVPLLHIKRQDLKIVLRFSVAEVRISAAANALCDRLTQGLPGNENPADQSL